MKSFLSILALVLCVIASSLAVWTYSAAQSLRALESRGAGDLALATDRLVNALFSYRRLAVALASDPRLKAEGAQDDRIADILRRAADISGALDFVLLDRTRRQIASATASDFRSWQDAGHVTRALDGALGRDVGIDPVSGRRAFSYAVPVFAEAGPVSRVLVVVIDLEAVEAEFRGSWPAIFMSDRLGVIYFSNRSELIFRDRNRSPGESGDPGAARPSRPFVAFTPHKVLGLDIWSVAAGRYLPRGALHIVRDLPVIGLRAEALVDIRAALVEATGLAAVAGTVVMLLGGIIFAVAGQRRVLALANVQLERRVANRTRELRSVNASLRAEVAERTEAQRALQRAQEDLIQAGKLSALGKMSAGISHELNQPLMAIQSFADNAAQFLARGDSQTAGRNLEKIADLARRMARIIRNFRAFARQEKDTVRRVDLVAVAEAAIEVSQSRLDRHGVTLHAVLPGGSVWVQGGEVRLQQVIVNLISNAVDAMAKTPRREIRLGIDPGAPVVLTVRDTGPGIEQPDKVFEPFYTTKEIGEDEGMGLGLSISYGLVQSFGGKIRGENAPKGGAVFTVELQKWEEEANP